MSRDILVPSNIQASQSRQKTNLLSTYLVSDDDESTAEVVEPVDDHEKYERIEVLAPSTLTVLSPTSQLAVQSTCGETNTDVLSCVGPSSLAPSSQTPRPVTLWHDDTIDSSTPRRSQYRVTFEIIKAKAVSALEKGSNRNRFERKKYISYTILIKRIPGLETKPAIIERRYSDFLTFYTSIKKRYSSLFKDVIFPRKILIGNFSSEVIHERSYAFQNFLTYCLSVSEVRTSKEFASFLFYPELREAKKCLYSIHLEEAANLLENVYFIQEKLYMHSSRPNGQLIHTLCCLIGCLNAVDNTAEAKKLAGRTFEIIFESPVVASPIDGHSSRVLQVDNLFESSPLVLPLIVLSLRLSWFSGSQRSMLERKLEELCRQQSLPRNFNSQPTLLEMILKKDFSTILE